MTVRRLAAPHVADEVVAAIHARRPLSLLRFGDGEAMFLGCPGYFQHAQKDQILWTWFGDRHLDPAALARLADDVVAGFRKADIVGIAGDGAAGVFKQTQATYSDLVGERPETALTIPSIHAYLYQQDGLARILEAARRVRLVGPHPVENLVSTRYHVEVTGRHDIPMESAWATGAVPEHFPARYDELRHELAPEAGELYLVGAGICGKSYCAWIRRRGGIAIDIGSVFDCWAGKLTRTSISAEDALANLNALIALEPGRAGPLADLARLHLRAGRLEEAKAAAERALAASERSAEHLYLASRIDLEMSRLSDALGKAREALESAPDAPDFWLHLGAVHQAAGRADEAQEALQAAERLLREAIDRSRFPAELNRKLSEALAARGQATDAAYAAKAAAEADPANPYLAFHAAHLLRRAGRMDEAVQALREAVDLEPENPTFWHHLGNMEAERGREAAEAAQRRAIALNPRIANTHYLLSKALAYSGRWPEALASAERAVQLSDDPGLLDHLTRLKRIS